MEKIKSLFIRNYEGDKKVRNEVVPGAEWVIQGEGVATRKFDGTCCLVNGNKLYKRYDAKQGKRPPEGFIQAQDPDPITGHWPGWLAVTDSPQDKYHREAFSKYAYGNPGLVDGTYELCGPKINGNNEMLDKHELIKHGLVKLEDCPRDFDGIKEYLRNKCIEGIVWHSPEGRMVKIKRKDFDYSDAAISLKQ